MIQLSPSMAGLTVVATLVVLLATGMPIAFALGLSAIGGLLIANGFGVFEVLAETMFAGIANLAYVSIPMFVLMGAAVAATPAGKDLYEALDRWLNRVPGGLVLSNIGACAIFAGMTGSSPATCAAIGKMGIPEMLKRGYPSSVATGSICAGGTLGILIPPSVTMIVYGIATETSIGRLFLAGVLPGLMLTAMFMAWALFDCKRKGFRFDEQGTTFTMKDKIAALPRVTPFLLIIGGTLYVLYGGVATPSEAAGAGAFLTLGVVIIMYRLFRPKPIVEIFSSTMRESVMIMMIMASAELFAFALSSLFITQSVASAIASLEVNRWVLMGLINVFLLISGMFLPPVAIIVMSAPLLYPIVVSSGFDPYWFAVILTINMEIGLITPPVGLNLFVVNAIAPQVRTSEVLWGAFPYVIAMMLGIFILCLFPQIATWLPDLVMGPT
ncbi:MAG TPA: TRAP transporter large permease [Xanthobacteraceae bacterium]|jgi:tripartite ATP-independent transporter DctM subunit|uniref:TRAP transporter large permease n=1 Tax=Roseixanthobacter TaxID=3462307 RepID=UPI000BC5B360|nr:MAG: C4-dicarboxylate ABC transporter [Rhizobiales bacterium 12-66-7]OYX69690.1 MAG: C4-dicarboxylate ABC transporter [Rhizobiales bacterium 32-66-11]OZB06534.1 MAG: C4-dicarboxylate ABC transporter [Rhizobiales bacterium 39-66-18]HQS07293.1 TRAP transporter large permease [Xanthobacteraceae bacterium]HQS47624.1 TRAP transporter large permease [Xanthobacteraceae bacterium]